MKEYKLKIVGITKDMELHLHGVTGEEWYTNISIPMILNLLAYYTVDQGDKKEELMLEHLSVYFYDKIENNNSVQ